MKKHQCQHTTESAWKQFYNTAMDGGDDKNHDRWRVGRTWTEVQFASMLLGLAAATTARLLLHYIPTQWLHNH